MEEEWQPSPVLLPETPYGQRGAQEGYSPRGRKTDLTEHEHSHTHTKQET